jgi:hypothetical protein
MLACHGFESDKKKTIEKIDQVEGSTMPEEREGRLLARKRFQLEKTRLIKAAAHPYFGRKAAFFRSLFFRSELFQGLEVQRIDQRIHLRTVPPPDVDLEPLGDQEGPYAARRVRPRCLPSRILALYGHRHYDAAGRRP